MKISGLEEMAERLRQMADRMRDAGHELENGISVQIPLDEGWLARQCPSCKELFRVKIGTGIKSKESFCPYCGNKAGDREYITEKQYDYARSKARAIAVDILNRAIHGYGKDTDITPEYEGVLSTELSCQFCHLSYEVTHPTSICPDCGQSTLNQFLEIRLNDCLMLLEALTKANLAEADAPAKIVMSHALSALDGMGRKIYFHSLKKEIGFQDLSVARDKLQRENGFDIATGVEQSEWLLAIKYCQLRHLYIHLADTVDERYIRKANDNAQPVGSRAVFQEDEVRRVIAVFRIVGGNLVNQLDRRIVRDSAPPPQQA
jgi:hypothetical protein